MDIRDSVWSSRLCSIHLISGTQYVLFYLKDNNVCIFHSIVLYIHFTLLHYKYYKSCIGYILSDENIFTFCL